MTSMAITRSHAHVALFMLVTFAVVGVQQVRGVAECMTSNNLKCFECDSFENALCADPFNWTALPPLKKCQGCCVKMLQGIGSQYPRVVRTCISEMQISMFMVDHVCMSESNRKGRLCFCEDDLCNSVGNPYSGIIPIILPIVTSTIRTLGP